MSLRRTARGKMIDMSALATKHETTRAVSNLKLNARGDIVDSNNKVMVKATDKVNNAYAKTVGNKSAHAQSNRSRVKIADTPVPKTPDFSELNELEKQFEIDDQEEDIQVIKTKAKKENG